MKLALGLSSAILAIAAASNISHGFDGFTGRHVVRLQLTDYPRQMAELHARGADIAGVDLPNKQVDLIVENFEKEGLKAEGYRILSDKGAGGVDVIDSRYQTPLSLENRLRGLNASYPALTELSSIGRTLEGRDIWVLKIVNNQVASPFGKPVLFINGMHHAREVMTPEIGLDMAEYLLSRHGSDAQATAWIDSNEIWIMPMVNPDGNNKVWTADNWWRKNTSGGNGVDINRNYPYQWDACDGSSSWSSAQDYHGPSAGSELETRAITAFIARIKPVFSISFHSYAEMVLYPYGCDGQFTETREVVEGIGRQMAALLPSDRNPGTYSVGTPPELLYSVDGGDIDWMYHEVQVLPYVIEVNSTREGFQPDYTQWRDRTVQKMRPAWQLLLNRMAGSGWRGELTSSGGEIPQGAVITVSRAGVTPFTQIYRASELGRFHLILNPGTYQVEVKAVGYQDYSGQVTVGEARVDQPIQLNRLAPLE